MLCDPFLIVDFLSVWQLCSYVAWSKAKLIMKLFCSLHWFGVVLLACLALNSGQDLSSGSGPDDKDDDEDIDFDFKQYLINAYCNQQPDLYCEESLLVCPCGSVHETFFEPNYFHLIQFFPCNPIHFQTAAFRDCDTFILYGATLAVRSLTTRKELEYLYLACFRVFADVFQPVSIICA